MRAGNLTLQGITDQELVKLLEVKIRHENFLGFNPQQMQVGTQNVAGKQSTVYNNVNLAWSSDQGLEAVQEIVDFLLRKDEGMQAQA